MMNPAKQSYFFSGTAVFFWSTVATAFKLALQELDVFQLIYIASGVSVVLLFVIILIRKKQNLLFSQSKKDLISSVLLGAFNPAIYYIILFKAYSLLPAQVAQPINMVWPIVLTLLSIPMLKQKIRWISFVALGISFIGVIFISSQGSIEGFRNISKTGVGLALLTSVLWSFYWILNVKDKRDEVVKLFTGFVFGFIFLNGIMIVFSDFNFPKGIPLGAAIYTGFFEVGITYVLWLNAMKLSNNNAKIGNLVFLAPFISLIFIRLILKETIFITTFIGLVFIIGGILIQQLVGKPENK
ncbi:MAG: DMT family transporter [Prolixibacteraceae bacterium]|nr:DMT family transporter [Prolixibacteraceae bacterium]MBN2773568.1 DMT family transporter [Prolixibacteraceae bacterium]